MAKVRKLKWNMRAVKAQISMKGADSDDSGFLNTMGSLNQIRCFMMMMASFWIYILSKTCVYTVA